MALSDCFVSVIAPIHNDARILESYVEEVTKVLQHNYQNYELILINDGSEDGTLGIATDLLRRYECIRLVNLSRNFGNDIAISCGLDSAIGDFIVVMLPESDPPQLVPELVRQAQQGQDLLIGVRTSRSNEPYWLRICTYSFYWFCKSVLKIPLIKNSTQFRVLSRQVVNAVLQVEDKYRYLRLLGSYVGYRSETFAYVPIQRDRRKNRRFVEAINLGLQIIILNSVHPLRFASYLSLTASLFNLVYIVYIFLVYLFKAKVAEGWVTLSLQNAVMFFCISTVLTVLCEYVGFMLDRLKGFPSYYIANEKNSSVLIANPERRNVVSQSENKLLD